jgi:hypothetical protein
MMSTRGRRPASVLVTIALMVMGVSCASSGTDEHGNLVQAVTRIGADFERGDLAAVCDRMSRSAIRQVGSAGHQQPDTCVDDMRRFFGPLEDPGGGYLPIGGRVLATTVDGDRASVRVRFAAGLVGDVPFVKRGDEWKLDSIAGAGPARAPVTNAPLPPAGRGALAFARRTPTGERPCPSLRVGRRGTYPPVVGGCAVRMASSRVDLNLHTLFGGLRLARCVSGYTLRVGGGGRAWGGGFGFEGGGACGDTVNCFGDVRGTTPGEVMLRSTGSGSIRGEVALCLDTCVGRFVGRWELRLTRRAGGWRVESAQPARGRASGIEAVGAWRLDVRNVVVRGDAKRRGV